MQLKPNMTEEDYGEAEFIVLGRDDKPLERGKHWNGGYSYTGAPNGIEPDALWPKIRPSLERSGWVFFRDVPGQARTARYQKNGHDSWIQFWLFAPDDIRFDLVEVAPLPVHLTLKPPAAKPEPVSVETGDFPWLAPMPGTTFQSGHREDGPLTIEVETSKGQYQQQMVGSGAIFKAYDVPPPLRSTLLLVSVYREALERAGWTIVRQIQGVNSADAILNAHYSANGRDIWATLHGGGDAYTILVADVGAEDLAKQLDRECHVALYGIYFDFNKATLRPDSAPTLNKILALLQSRPGLKLEVQGHTDNVGGNDYNQKLSEARAGAVVQWLTQKGIAADRLTANGYGLSMPVADNDSDEGRAKNRRVELRKQGCNTQT